MNEPAATCPSPIPRTRPSSLAVAMLVSLLALVAWAPVQAIPSFARQTSLPCTACHTAFPQLNGFGRQFKLSGYVLSNGDVGLDKKLSMVLQPSYTQTSVDQQDPPSRVGPNDNLALTQGSLFFGGRIAGNVGGFVQVTYDGVENVLSWDNTDFRFADSANVFGESLVWGIDANNNPTVQDLWNTTPAWGFPFASSSIAPTPAASTLIQGVGGQVAGAGVYALWNDLVYLELTAYHALGDQTLRAFGVPTSDVADKLDGAAPYWRLALQHAWGPHYLSAGTFGMQADTFPGADQSARTDRFTDIGFDLQYQYSNGPSEVALRLASIEEHQDLNASQALQLATSSSGKLNTFNGSLEYVFDKTWGITAGYTNLRGDSDPLLYGTDSGSPNSTWYTVQLDWLPLNKNGGPSAWPWFNPKIVLQYVAYTRFDGSTRAASDNDTLYLMTWLPF